MSYCPLKIYRMSDKQILQILSSHKQPIQQLVFSPWPVDGPENNPLVLVSLSEQMCFWNIKYVINNPLDALKKVNGIRRSSRYSKERKWDVNSNTFTDININGHGTNGNGRTAEADKDYWEDKTGASDKPELLACIKFVGNSATKLVTNVEFSQFITIDNEGDIYALQTTRPAGKEKPPGELLTIAVTQRLGQISLGNNLMVPS